MKVKFEIELDTESEKDLALIEEVVYYIEDIKEILEKLEQGLNKKSTRRTKQ